MMNLARMSVVSFSSVDCVSSVTARPRIFTVVPVASRSLSMSVCGICVMRTTFSLVSTHTSPSRTHVRTYNDTDVSHVHTLNIRICCLSRMNVRVYRIRENNKIRNNGSIGCFMSMFGCYGYPRRTWLPINNE